MDVKIEEVQMQDLGQIGEITVTKDDTLILRVSIKSLKVCFGRNGPGCLLLS